MKNGHGPDPDTIELAGKGSKVLGALILARYTTAKTLLEEMTAEELAVIQVAGEFLTRMSSKTHVVKAIQELLKPVGEGNS
jgi:hypothetical protein